MPEDFDVPLWTPAVCAIVSSSSYHYPCGWSVTVAYRREGWAPDEWVTTRYEGLASEEAGDVLVEVISSLLRA